jgi:hypothetical protein
MSHPLLLVGGLALAVGMLAPLGRYNPYPHTAFRADQVVRACGALPSGAISTAVRRPVTTSWHLVQKPKVKTEYLFPSVSISECDYKWRVTCTQPTTLQNMALVVNDQPDGKHALGRYTYVRLLLEAETTRSNDLRHFMMGGRAAYELAIGNEVLVRVLDGHFIVDMHFNFCGTANASEQESVAGPLAGQLRFPISALAAPSRLQPSAEAASS